MTVSESASEKKTETETETGTVTVTGRENVNENAIESGTGIVNESVIGSVTGIVNGIGRPMQEGAVVVADPAPASCTLRHHLIHLRPWVRRRVRRRTTIDL